MDKAALLLTTRSFFKRLSGRENVLHTAYESMQGSFDKVYVAGFSDDEADLKLKKPFFLVGIVRALILYVFKRFSFNEGLFYSRSNQKRLEHFIHDRSIEFIYVDSIRMFLYVNKLKCRGNVHVHVDLDDLMSRRYEAKLESRSFRNLAGVFSNPFLEWVINIFEHVMPVFLRLESSRLFNRELVVAKSSDTCSLVSAFEASYLSSKSSRNVLCLPMSVDVSDDVPVAFIDLPDRLEKPSFIFLGNMYYSGNIDSLNILINKFPKTVEEYGVLVVGRVSDQIKDRYRDYNLEFYGYARNFTDCFVGKIAMLAPMADAGGVKTKILDAFACGLPVVTNSSGIAGLSVENNKEILVCENDMELNSSMASLLDRGQRHSKVHLAHNYVKSTYSKVVVDKYYKSLFSLIKV